ncbi:uncharacterized protein OCT59_002316 [Rhizophagus irregularis]|uniref:uncharacterized protein n=1 Tax=Rhizophagus irregularis TaxID=588596 RepID=UPI003328809E|nr:hypothetical protein OCT59_002316 [Rhizophagus irregularis]
MKTSQAYITNVRVDLCSSYARGDVNIAESILKSNSLPNVDEDFQIERYNARIIARISDDLVFDPIDKENDQDDIIDVNTETCDHLLTDLDYATIFGHVEIVILLIKAGANVQGQIKLNYNNITSNDAY